MVIFCLFHCFHQTINRKHWILPQYTFFLKKVINNVFFNFFRSIIGILNKALFYMYNICNLNKEENSAKKVTFSMFFFLYLFFCWEKTKIYILFLDNIFFLWNCINDPLSNVFRRFTTFKGNHLFYEKKYDFTPKVTF